MQRYDIINKLIKENNFKSYLEIGVRNPAYCFDLIDCETKEGVDPGIEFEANPVKYPYESDTFFEKLESNELDKDPDFKWDIIFIDGLHVSYQVLRDIKNSLKHLSPNGFIVLHDCNPQDIFFAREDYSVNGRPAAWNGTVWKALHYLRVNSSLDICTLNTDCGCGIIRFENPDKPRPSIEFDNHFYEYNTMSKKRRKDLGLIELHEFEDWLTYKLRV
jgi:hypothetical protein